MSRSRKTVLPKEVFISHTSRNRGFARRVAETLRLHGAPVWYSETNIVGAKQWHVEIGAALARCDWFLLILSPQSVKSSWVKRELLYALNDRHYDNRIVPLLYRPCNASLLSWTLANIQSVDFTASEKEGFASLLRVWGLAYTER